jgi:hypothetical protein
LTLLLLLLLLVRCHPSMLPVNAAAAALPPLQQNPHGH